MKLSKAKVLLGASLRVSLARSIWLLLILVVYTKISLGLGSFSPLRWPHSRVGPVEILTSQQGYGFLHIGTGIGDEPLTVAGIAPQNSINVHADSLVRIRVTGDQRFLKGECTYPDHVTQGRVRCIIADARKFLYLSLTLSHENPISSFNVEIPPSRELFLVVVPDKFLHQAHASWVNLE